MVFISSLVKAKKILVYKKEALCSASFFKHAKTTTVESRFKICENIDMEFFTKVVKVNSG